MCFSGGKTLHFIASDGLIARIRQNATGQSKQASNRVSEKSQKAAAMNDK